METILQSVPVGEKAMATFWRTGTFCRMVSIRCFSQKRWRLACGTRLPENPEGALAPSCRMRRSAQALRRSGVVADVVVGLGHADVELGVRRHLEGLAGLGGEPLVRAVELVLAGA